MSILRGLLGGSAHRRPDPAAVPVREVGHRVFVERPPDVVWAHLVSPREGGELGVGCVRVLALPRHDTVSLPEFASVWRRPNGRLWAGLSTVVALETGRRVVARAAGGIASLDLVTTLEPMDQGCVVSQHLDGVSASDPAAAFATAWMERALLGLKADLEGGQRHTGGDEDAPGRVERESLAGFGPVLGQPGVAPVSVRASIDIAAPPARLWTLLTAPTSEQLLKPTVERLVGVELADESGVEHVLALHRRDDGRQAVSVSRVVEASEPTRIVERDLTSPLESDVETTIAATAEGSLLTEVLTAWLPSGPGKVVDGSDIAALMRTRLEVVKHLAEHGVEPQRDPRTGFLPPGQPPPADPQAPDPILTGLPSRPSVPSSVLLPPPHVVAPAAGYTSGHDWWWWSDFALFFGPSDVASW
ncbi:hypothetical protein GCM10027053_20990 [Intrasporangium mesophilum]